MSDSYETIADNSRTEIKVKKSRFIGTARYVRSVDEATDIVREISSEFHDATHNCWAYRVGLGQDQKFKYSDAGEPSGTAGRPILDAIDRNGLVDTCVVVTRYFGGIKLGTGGLSRAYRDAAIDVLDAAGMMTRYLMMRLRFEFNLTHTNVVLRTISSEVCTTVDSVYSDVGKIVCDIRRDSVEQIRNKLVSLTNGRIKIEAVVP